MTEILGDSAEYEFITEGVELSKDVDGLCIELGLRRGFGTKTIIDAIKDFCPDKVSIAVDPYGSIEYEHREGEFVVLDYSNTMKNECMQSIHAYAEEQGVHFIPFILEDTEFFKSFKDGVPIYRTVKQVINQYSFVHFDAPHAVLPLKTEIDFFNPRTPIGGAYVFDDIDFYPHNEETEPYLFKLGFDLIKKGGKKALYRKVLVY